MKMGLKWCIPVLLVTMYIAPTAAQQNQAPEVHREPSSLLVPVNTTATFECIIHHCGHGCEVHWIINETSTAHQHQQNHHENQGFAFSSQHNDTTRVYTATVSARASAVLNNTRMCCLIQDVIYGSRKSRQAMLLVISENPLISNPSLTLQESTSLLLEWSPPFLWPGQQIDHFRVSLTNRSDDNITYHRVNATFSDAVVSLTFDFGNQGASLCSELMLEISAVLGLAKLPTYNISIQYQPCPTTFDVRDVKVTVLFTSMLEPLVLMNITLPSPICFHQNLSYTIIITENVKGHHNLTPEHHAYYGPFSHIGPGTVHQEIMAGLNRDKEYSARVTVSVLSKVTTSHQVQFNTLFSPSPTVCNDGLRSGADSGADVFHYQLSMGISLTVSIFILVSLIIVIVFTCIILCRKRKLQSKGYSDNRTMVHNPIYDSGPHYETVSHYQSNPEFTTITTNVLNATAISHDSMGFHLDKNAGSWNENYMVMTAFDVPAETIDDRFGENTKKDNYVKYNNYNE